MRLLALLALLLVGLAGRAEAQPVDYRSLPSCSGANAALNYNASSLAFGCVTQGAAGGPASYYTINLTGGAGLVPSGPQSYPGVYGSTFELLSSGNATLLNPQPWGWANQRTGLCMVQGYSASGSVPICPPSGGLSINGPSDFANYPSIDDVQIAAINSSMPPLATPSGVFTATTFTPNSPFTPTTSLQLNMQVETNGANPWRSFITGWSTNTGGAITGLTVAGWYQAGNTSAGQVPTDTGIAVNPADRIWNLNTIVTLSPGGYAQQATGYEIDVNNAKAPPASTLAVNGILIGSGNSNPSGATCGTSGAGHLNTAGTCMYDVGSALAIQGGAQEGVESRSGHNAFFLANPDGETGSYNAGFLTYQNAGAAFQAFDGTNGFKFAASSVDGGLDLGAYGVSTSPAQSPAVRFHSQGGASSTPASSIFATGTALTINAGDFATWINNIEQFEVYAGQAGATDHVAISGGTSSTPPAIITSGTGGAAGLTLQPRGGNIYLNAPTVSTGTSSATGFQPGLSTVAALPTCNSSSKGLERAVTDATSPTFLGTLTGGGAVASPAFCNGTAWVAY